MLARDRPARWRIPVVTAVVLWIVLGGFARLYVGDTWLSGLLGGWSLSRLVRVAGRRLCILAHTRARAAEGRPVAVTVVLATAGVWTVPAQWQLDRAARPHVGDVVAMTVDQWLRGGWQRAGAAHRDRRRPRGISAAAMERDVGHARPASRAGRLAARGAVVAGHRAALLLPQAPVEALPVLPRYTHGESTRRVFVRVDPGQPESRLVLRLWRYPYVLQDALGMRPLWYGALYRETLHRPARLMTIVRTTTIDDAATMAKALSVEPAIEHPPTGMANAPAEMLLVWMVRP